MQGKNVRSVSFNDIREVAEPKKNPAAPQPGGWIGREKITRTKCASALWLIRAWFKRHTLDTNLRFIPHNKCFTLCWVVECEIPTPYPCQPLAPCEAGSLKHPPSKTVASNS